MIKMLLDKSNVGIPSLDTNEIPLTHLVWCLGDWPLFSETKIDKHVSFMYKLWNFTSIKKAPILAKLCKLMVLLD